MSSAAKKLIGLGRRGSAPASAPLVQTCAIESSYNLSR